jgi:hydrogenase nickel incorporation protein HypA/HybF
MHELAVCQALVEQVNRIAAQQDARSASLIRIRVGPLSGVVADLLMSAFPLAAAGSAAEGAELQISEASIRVRCQTCGAETDATANRLLCGACGDWHTQLIAGDELILESVELQMKEAVSHV